MNAYDIILRPVVTERAMDDLAERKYTFKVLKTANKTEVKKAIETIFGVDVELSLIHISEPTRLHKVSRMPSSA